MRKYAIALSSRWVFWIMLSLYIGIAQPLSALAIHTTQVFEHIQSPDHPKINTMTQDSNGQIWLGSPRGLFRFVGTSLISVPLPGYESVDITALCALENGTLLIGTRQGQLLRLEIYSQPRIVQNISDNASSPWHSINAFEVSNGRLWIATDSGLFTWYQEHIQAVEGMDSVSIHALANHPQGGLLLATAQGVFKFGKGSKQLLTTIVARDLLPEMDGSVWLTSSKGLFQVFPDGSQRHFFQGSQETPISHSDTWSIARDGLGYLWVGHALGLDRFRPNLGFVHQPHFKQQHLSGRAEPVFLLFTDSFGVMWAGSRQGLDKLSPSQPEHYKIGVNNGLSNSRVHAVLEDDTATLWIGSNAGLDRLGQKGQVQTFRKGAPGKGLSGQQVRALFLDSQHRLWIASGNGGLDCFHLKENRLERLPKAAQRIQSLCQWDQEALIVAGEKGLSRFRIADQSWQTLNGPTQIKATLVDQQKRLWVGSASGLYLINLKNPKLKPEAYHLTHLRGAILSLCEDSSANLWVGSEMGMTRVGMGHQMDQTYYGKMQGLPGDVVYAIEQDLFGRLWVATNGGIASIFPDAEQFQTYGQSFGIGPVVRPTGASFSNHVGALYFGSMAGLHLFKPRTPINQTLPPISRITMLEDGRERFAYPSDTSAHTLHSNYLKLSFDIYHSENPERNMVAYRLLGRDQQWQKATGSSHTIAYNDLEPGVYQFQLRAAANDGVWESSMDTLFVEVPHQTIPVWVFLVTGNLILLAILLIYFVNRLKKQRAAFSLERLQMKRDLERLRELKTDFLVMATRQLSTPLSDIVAIAQSLLDGATGRLGEATRANLGMVAAAGRRLLDVVHRLRQFSRITNHEALTKDSLDIRACTQVILADSQAKRGQTQCKVELAENLPSVIGHEDSFQETLRYLVDFCLGLVKDGNLLIRAHLENEHVVMTLAVSGPLLDQYKRARAIQALEHTGTLSQTELDGFHIGLVIANQLLANMGAHLSAFERQETLFITFSMEPATEITPRFPRVIDSAEIKLTPTLSKAINAGKKFHILVVDDSPSTRQVIQHFLGAGDYLVSEATTGFEAIELLKDNHGVFDLVLLDLILPQMNGYEVCKQIREYHNIHELPVILLVSDGKAADAQVGFSVGVNDFLEKPISQDLLIARVQTHLHLLDISRTLEDRVQRRTQQLQQRNQEILKTQNQLILQAKMASLGTLTAGIAHEIKNPLNFVTNFAEIVVQLAEEVSHTVTSLKNTIPEETFEDLQLDVEDLKQNTERIQVHGKRANSIVQSMMEVAKEDVGDFREHSFNHLVDKYVNIAYQGAMNNNQIRICMEKDYDNLIQKISVAANSLSRVIVNLVNNAIEAVLERYEACEETYQPYIWIRTRALGDGVELIVRDNGIGIEKQHTDQIFNPFFTTKPQGSGHIGLGLYFSYDVVTSQHQGRLELESIAWDYTEVKLFIPIL